MADFVVFALLSGMRTKAQYQPEFRPASLIAPSNIFRNKVFSDVAGGIYRLKLSDGCWKQFVNAQFPGKFCEFVTFFGGDGEKVSILNGENVTSDEKVTTWELGIVEWISIGRCMTSLVG